MREICTIFSISVASSLFSLVWKIVTLLWPWYWLLISLLFLVWVGWEITTRHGSSHYNSANGFSPTFNRFVGSGTYLGIQGVVFFFFKIFFGEAVYCIGWPYVVHFLVFFSTGLVLRLVGFWPRLKEPGRRRK